MNTHTHTHTIFSHQSQQQQIIRTRMCMYVNMSAVNGIGRMYHGMVWQNTLFSVVLSSLQPYIDIYLLFQFSICCLHFVYSCSFFGPMRARIRLFNVCKLRTVLLLMHAETCYPFCLCQHSSLAQFFPFYIFNYVRFPRHCRYLLHTRLFATCRCSNSRNWFAHFLWLYVRVIDVGIELVIWPFFSRLTKYAFYTPSHRRAYGRRPRQMVDDVESNHRQSAGPVISRSVCVSVHSHSAVMNIDSLHLNQMDDLQICSGYIPMAMAVSINARESHRKSPGRG